MNTYVTLQRLVLLFLYLICLIPFYNFHISSKRASEKINHVYNHDLKRLEENKELEIASYIEKTKDSQNSISNGTKSLSLQTPDTYSTNNEPKLNASIVHSSSHSTENGATRDRSPLIELTGSKIKTNAQCYEVAKSGAVDVLGNSMGSGHYCVVDNLCVDKTGAFVLFDDERDQQVYQFPWVGFDNLKSTRYENTSAPTFFNTKRKIALEKGLTVLMKPTYCCVHIRHFAESLPTLLLSLMSMQKNCTLQKETGIKPDFSLQRIVLVTKANVIGFYVKFMLESVFRYQQELNEDVHLETFTHNHTSRCFERAIVPGSSYLLFHNQYMGSLFRDSLYKEIFRTDRFLPPQARMNIDSKFDRNGLIELEKKHRVVLVASRTSKRTISDKDQYYGFLRNMAAKYGAVIKVVEFGKLSPYYQARNCMNSSMLWSIHGNDLTNMMLLQRGSAIIELNPVFFFEPGYYEMAKNLGIHYFSWTCTTQSCAFGGNTTKWDEVFGSRKNFFYNTTNRVITMRHKQTQEYYEPFIYPETGYVGYSCDQCNRMSFDSALSDIYYSDLRESNVKVMPHKRKLEKIFQAAADKIGWEPVISMGKYI